MPLKLITAPTTEPVTLADAKSHLRVSGTDDDALITALISAARQDAEHRLGRALITQTWELTLDAFTDTIELPLPVLASVTSIKYIDATGTEITLSSAAYTVDTDSEPGRVYPVYGTSWPGIRSQTNAVRIRYVAGAASVDAAISQWMLLRISALYENRESVVSGQPIQAAPRDFADGLLDRYKVYS